MALGLLGGLVGRAAGPAATQPVLGPTTAPAADFASPRATYRTYIHALMRNDRKSAAVCWATRDQNEATCAAIIDALFIGTHRFDQLARAKFQKEGQEAMGAVLPLAPGCTDEAMQFTLAHLHELEEKVEGDTAELILPGREHDVQSFLLGVPVPFQRVRGLWKMDLRKCAVGPGKDDKSDELLAPGSWGSAFRAAALVLDQVNAEIESGRVATPETLHQLVAAKAAAMHAELEAEYNAMHPATTRPQGR
jgi:hypothetical protein